MAGGLPTREIYWNISGWVLVYLFFGIALVILSYGLYKRYKLWRLGMPENRFDFTWLRLLSVLKFGFGHARILKDWYPGVMHFLLFWGFVVLTIGTILVFLQADFGIPILYGNFYLWYSLALDVAGLLAIVAILMALVRRFVLRPSRLDNKLEDTVSLLLILAVLVTGFILEGLRIVGTQDPWALWSPVGLLSALPFWGLGEFSVRLLHRVLWWVHMLLAMSFIAYIGYSKLLHIITSPLNQYFRKLGPKGALSLIDLADESAESFGVSKVEEFSWKALFDSDACTRCGRCQDNCPAYLSDKPLSPKRLIQDIKSHLEAKSALLLKSRGAGHDAGEQEAQSTGAFDKQLIGDIVSEDAIWSCTTCASCEEQCPVFAEHVSKIVDMRRNLVLMESRFPPEVSTVFKNMENNGNPWGIGWANRGDWAKELGVALIEDDPDAEYLYWVGCAGSFDERNKKVAVALAQIMSKAGISFAILGKQEKCCGDSARRIGNEYLYQTLAQENIETLKGYNVKKIVTACPHCFNALKNEYPQLGGNFEVIHHSQLISDLLRTRKLQLTRQLNIRVTYHDSCYLGRYNNLYCEPRTVLRSIRGVMVQEMARFGYRSFCCGAGGGRMWMEEHLGKRINELRTEQALSVKPEAIATACPFCLTMFEDGLKSKGVESVQVTDLAELVATTLL